MRKRMEFALPKRNSKIFSLHPVQATRVPPAAVWSEVLQAWVIESADMGWHPGHNGHLGRKFKLSDLLMNLDEDTREAFEEEDRVTND